MADARAVGISGTGTKNLPTPADASVGEYNNTQEPGVIIYMWTLNGHRGSDAPPNAKNALSASSGFSCHPGKQGEKSQC